MIDSRYSSAEVRGPARRRVHGPHPLAYVANRSHALYPDSTIRVPNWAECKNLGFGAEILLGPGFSAGIREGMDYPRADIEPRPPAELPRLRARLTLEPVNDDTDFMRFEGRWGAGDQTALFGAPLDEGPGPETPTQKALWRTR